MQQKISNNILVVLSLLSLFFLEIGISQAAGVDGACGSANGQVVPSAPTTNLCSAGTASVVTGNGPWTWTCAGSDATCTAGDSKDCTTTDSCAGKQTCTAGAWGACVKNVSTCGTNDYCNDQGQRCAAATGQCVNKCGDCPCPSDKPTCGADGSCSGSVKCDPYTQVTLADGTCASQCSDGTAVNRCSPFTLDKQCVGKKDSAGNIIGVELIDACQACGCPGYESCHDGTCVKDPDLPESFTWANKDGVNWMSPVRDQGDCGSCWDFAAVGGLEAMYNVEHGAGSSPDLSEQSVLSCGNSGGCGGGQPASALSYIQAKGLVVESCSPYGGPWADSIPCVDSCAIAKHGFSSFRQVDTDLFRFVYKNGPLPIILNWKPQGHAVVMIGWTKEGYILYKNSWGGNSYDSWESPNTTMIGPGSAQPYGTY